MENKKLDFESDDWLWKMLEKGFEEVEEIRENNEKLEKKKFAEKIDNEFFFHKQFLEFKIWIKGQNPTSWRKEANHLICLKQDFEVAMDKHHVNERDVVFLPTLIHRAAVHERGDGKLEGVIG